MIFVGDDWAEDHHDIVVVDEQGTVLVRRRLPEGLEGITQLHALLTEHAHEPEQVVVSTETDRGLWSRLWSPPATRCMRSIPKRSAATVTAIPAQAPSLIRQTPRCSPTWYAPTGTCTVPSLAILNWPEAIKVLARAQQRLVWARQRQVNTLRSILREFYPAALAAFGSDLASADALAVLGHAPMPGQGSALTLSALTALLRGAGRRRNLDQRAHAIAQALRSKQLQPCQTLARAFGASVAASVGVIAEMNRQLQQLADELEQAFDTHPDAKDHP
jgi:hypothetical protein